MDEQSVRNVASRYCQLIDDGRIDDVAALFTEDAVLDIGAFGIREKGRAAIGAKLRETSNTGVKGAHCTFNPIIEISGKTATGAFDYVWVNYDGAPRIGLGGRYLMSFVAGDQGWRIREMKVELRSDPRFISG